MMESETDLPPPIDNVEEEMRRILQALDVIYSSHDDKNGEWNRRLADRYLVRFQSTPIAWMVCDQLLNESLLQVQFFAAQTLHKKCQSDIFQLPTSSMPSLRDSLVKHLHRAENGPYKNQLALAVAALAVQMNWITIVQDLASNHDSVLILKLLPEECSSNRLVVEDETLRYMMEDYLLSNAKQVLAYPSFDLWLSWIRYLPIPAQTIVEANIVPSCLSELNQNEVAVDVLVEVIRLYPSHAPMNKILINLLLPLVMQLPLDQALQRGDEDVQRAVCRIFTELGESYISILLEEDGQEILTKVTTCTSISNKSISGMTHNFWYRFVVELEQMDDFRKRQDQVDLYTPHLLQLLDVCLVHLEYPSNGEPSDDIDEFHRERFYLGETIEECCRLMGGTAVLERVGLRLSCCAINNWKSIEACLYGMQPLAKYIPHDENQFMPECFLLISKLPSDIEPLRFTVSLFVGKYAPWVASHPDHIQPLLRYLAQGLSISKCARASAIAIKCLCERIALGESVLQLYNQVCNEVDLGVELEILEGLCKGIEINQVRRFTSQIIGPVGNRLLQLLQNPSASCEDITNEIDRMTTIIRFLIMPVPVFMEVLRSSWAILESVGYKYTTESLVAEKLCRFHKHALRACNNQSYSVMLPALMNMIISFYQSSHQAPYLYLASIVIMEYPTNPDIFQMIQALCKTSLAFLNTLHDLTNHPDVVEELTYCLGRLAKHSPEPLLSNSPLVEELLSNLMQFALLGLELDHKAANQGLFNFLQQLITHGVQHRNAINVRVVVQRYGEAITTKLVQALAGGLPVYCVDGGNGSISGVLYQINRLYPQDFQKIWLISAFSRLQVPYYIKQNLLTAAQEQCSQNDFDIDVRSFKTASERFRRIYR